MSNKPFIPDEKMHTGHRSRMRSKFLSYGARIFDTYELLEMLLYYSVPYKDTNPIAKRLLEEFGSLDGVLSASREELLALPGIGERTVRLLSAVDSVSDILFLDERLGRRLFNDYSVAGSYLAEKLSTIGTPSVMMLLLDNSMREISTVTLYTDVDFGSGAIKPKAFIDAAILAGASVVIVAHSHPYGPNCHFDSENQTCNMIIEALISSGIMVAEIYVTAGSDYCGMDRPTRGFVRTSSELDAFRASKARFIREMSDSDGGSTNDA